MQTTSVKGDVSSNVPNFVKGKAKGANIRNLPHYLWSDLHPNAKAFYVTTRKEADSLIEQLPKGAFGYDQEYPPTFKKNTPQNPVAVVQIACAEMILVIQISAMDSFPEKLKDFMESHEYSKCGVGIQGDVSKLYMDHSVSTVNCIDLSLLARSVDNPRWKGKYKLPIGLARLTEAYLGLHLAKDRKISCSDWAASLTPAQQDYARNDAHVSFVILEHLNRMMLSMEDPPREEYYTFDSVRNRLCYPSGESWIPRNPKYDPGPPPIPKKIPPPKAQDIITNEESRTSNLRGASTSSNPGPSNRHRRQYQWRGRRTGNDSPASNSERPSGDNRWHRRRKVTETE